MKKKHWFKRFLYRLIVIIFRVKIVFPEREPRDISENGLLVCCNHISLADPVLIVSGLNIKTKFMAKKELFKIPLVNWFIKTFGAFPVNRGSADLSAMKTAISILNEPNIVGMFPQGSRFKSIEPTDTPVKNGVGLLVSRSMCDVLPLAIIVKNNKYRFGRNFYIVVGNVIRYNDLNVGEKNKDEFQRISDVIFNNVCELYQHNKHLVDKK